MDYDSLLELVKKRRSIRHFKPDPIPDEYVEKILEVARWAPSALNAQPCEFVVVKNPETRARIVELFKEATIYWRRMELTREPEKRAPGLAEGEKTRFAWESAPVLIIICADPRVIATEPMHVQIGFKPTILITDMAYASLYLHLAAATLGLAHQFVSGAAYPQLGVLLKGLLGIPMDWQLLELMAIGYPDAEPRPRYVRPPGEMVHYEHVDKSRVRTDEQIKDLLLMLRDWWMHRVTPNK